MEELKEFTDNEMGMARYIAAFRGVLQIINDEFDQTWLSWEAGNHWHEGGVVWILEDGFLIKQFKLSDYDNAAALFSDVYSWACDYWHECMKHCEQERSTA